MRAAMAIPQGPVGVSAKTLLMKLAWHPPNYVGSSMVPRPRNAAKHIYPAIVRGAE